MTVQEQTESSRETVRDEKPAAVPWGGNLEKRIASHERRAAEFEAARLAGPPEGTPEEQQAWRERNQRDLREAQELAAHYRRRLEKAKPKPMPSAAELLARIAAGELPPMTEVDAALTSLDAALREIQARKKGTGWKQESTEREVVTCMVSMDVDRKKLLDWQRRLKGYVEVRKRVIHQERAEKKAERLATALGLTQFTNPALLLDAVVHLLRWKVSERHLQEDPDLRAIMDASELCLQNLAKAARQGGAS